MKFSNDHTNDAAFNQPAVTSVMERQTGKERDGGPENVLWLFVQGVSGDSQV